MTPDTNELVEAIRAALTPQRPPASEGWQSMAELMETLNAAESVVRRQLKKLGDRVERQNCGGWMYYKLHRNGKPGA